MTLSSFQGLTEEQYGLVNDLFEWLVDPCLYFIRKNCKTFVQTSDMHLVQSLMNLYTCLMDEIIQTLEQKPHEGDEPSHQDHGLTNQQVRCFSLGLLPYLYKIVGHVNNT